MKKLKWRNATRKLSDLAPYESNPRELTEKQYNFLKKSLEKFNLAEVPAINTDNRIIAGHQRVRIMLELYGGKHEIDVRLPNRTLSEDEFREYLIRSNANTGQWDNDILANEFDESDLEEWGFDEGLFKGSFGADDFEEPEPSDSMKITLEYTAEDYSKVINAFGKLPGTKEQALFELLNLS